MASLVFPACSEQRRPLWLLAMQKPQGTKYRPTRRNRLEREAEERYRRPSQMQSTTAAAAAAVAVAVAEASTMAPSTPSRASSLFFSLRTKRWWLARRAQRAYLVRGCAQSSFLTLAPPVFKKKRVEEVRELEERVDEEEKIDRSSHPLGHLSHSSKPEPLCFLFLSPLQSKT